jgi:hypothetical protein
MACLHSNSECFSWAVLSTAQEKYYFLCALCGSSEAGGETFFIKKTEQSDFRN